MPREVSTEVLDGQANHRGIATPGLLDWVSLVTLTEEEAWTQLVLKAAMGGDPGEHLGECAVIACARHRGLTALIDERDAISQADAQGVTSHDTLWLVIEAYATIFKGDRVRTEGLVDDLLAAGMYLPVSSGQELFAWAYAEGYLPRSDD